MLVRDIAFLARLVNDSVRDHRTMEDLAELSPIFQPMAKRLLTALPHEHQPIWDDFLAGRPRRDPIAPVADKSALEQSP